MAFAPTSVSGQKVLGLRAGLNVTKFAGAVSADTKVGLNIGATLYLPVSANVGVTVGAAYTQKGVKGSDQGIGVSLDLDYVEIPALLTVSIPSAGPVGARFFLGPAFAFEVGCEFSAAVGETDIGFDCGDVPGGTEEFDIGAIGGVGVSYDATNSVILSMDLLYNLGLRNLDEAGDTKNRAFSVQAGVGFPLG